MVSAIEDIFGEQPFYWAIMLCPILFCLCFQHHHRFEVRFTVGTVMNTLFVLLLRLRSLVWSVDRGEYEDPVAHQCRPDRL